MKIKGVELIDRKTLSDDRGDLTEIYRTDEPYHTKINQVYLVENPVRNTIRAFHKHEKLIDYFSIIHGRAKFVLYDDRQDSPTFNTKEEVILTSNNKKLLVIPAGVYHGWMSLSDGTILLSIASETYNKEKADETRIDPFSFGETWKIKFK